MFAIELFFDSELDQAIRRIWTQIAETGTIQAMTAIEGTRPHISLAVSRSATLEQVKQLVEGERTISSFPIQFESIGSFPTSGTLFLSPVFHSALRTIHEQVNESMVRLGLENGPYYRPDCWYPHCTVGTNLSRTGLTTAFERTIQAFQSPLTGSIVEIGAVEVVHINGRHVKSPQVASRML